MKKKKLKLSKTGRGFPIINFKDLYGVDCSLQQSSLADKSALWFGPNEADPKVCRAGGWEPVQLPFDAVCTTRAHLDEDMVRELVDYLNHWLNTGNLDKE